MRKFRFTAAAAMFAAASSFGQGTTPAPVATPAPAAGQSVEVVEGCSECLASACDAEKGCRILENLVADSGLGKSLRLTANGYVVGGYNYNPSNPRNRINGPVTFMDRSNDVTLNQAYLSIGRAVDTESCSMDWGFKVDALYGTDAVFTQAYGLDQDIVTESPLYRLAIPQAYGELWLPGAKTTLRAGHFYTILGYEVVTTPDNFFTTLPYTFQYGEPFTHTGAMAITKIGENTTVTNAVIRGWDSWFDNNNALSYMGGITTKVGDKLTLTMNTVIGPEQDEPNFAFQGVNANPAGSSANRFLYSFVAQYQINCKLKYVFQHDLGIQEDGSIGAPVPGALAGAAQRAEWYGINQYLFYEVNDKLSLGLRAEWFRDDDGARVAFGRYANTLGPHVNDQRFANVNTALGRGVAGANYYALTLGANYKVSDCFIIRPDVRYDWQDRDDLNTQSAFKDSTRANQLLFGLNVIYKF